uniref:Peptidase S1 domain-containing protein n=1 Tax=Varanus komodoensis TaxID=61221 RepID=A0A8D2IRV2_VARKO
MLVQLDPPAILGDTVKTIPIAKECASHGTKCMVSGWGTTAFPKGKEEAQGLPIYLQEQKQCGDKTESRRRVL